MLQLPPNIQKNKLCAQYHTVRWKVEKKVIANLENVSFSFNERNLFNQVNLNILQGEIFMLVGNSGSGLTTFLRLISGLIEPLKGTIKLFDADIHKVTQQQLIKIRQMTGFVFQKSGLINNMTVLDNVALPLRYHTDLKENEIQTIAKNKLRFAGIEKYEAKLPAQLSEECKKLGGFARALALEPRLIFYDGLATGLGECHSNSVLSLIGKLKEEKGTTTVIASHNQKFAQRKIDRLAVLKNKKIELM